VTRRGPLANPGTVAQIALTGGLFGRWPIGSDTPTPDQTMMRQLRSPSRWAWVLPVAATAIIVACDNSLEGIDTQGTWGFVTLGASKNAAGAHFAKAEGLFFMGNLSAVPNADFTSDSCADVPFSEGNSLSGVTYLDAGTSVNAILGGIERTLDRTTTTGGISYVSASPLPYTPGDSIVINVQGVAGGFPAGTIRAKTAEAFQFPTDIPVPAGSEAIQLTWTAPQDVRSAMVVSLRYATSQNPGVATRNVLCTFVDDGVDSIPFRFHQNWSASEGVRSVVATRLRTNYVAAGDGNLGVVSTYQVPTPPNP
jgi:hypothetical protein